MKYILSLQEFLFENTLSSSWTDDSVRDEASKYDSLKDFSNGNPEAFQYAKHKNLISNFKWLLKDNTKPYCVYVYIDEDNKVAYVGLTSNKKERHHSHTTGIYRGRECYSAVFNYFNGIGENIPEPVYLENDLTPEEAQIKEDEYRKKYEGDGYFMLNKAKTGIGTGSLGIVKWNTQTVIAEASKYETKEEFRKGEKSKGAYNYAYEHNLLDVIFGESGRKRWNEETVRKAASKYKTKEEFKKSEDAGGWRYAYKHKLLDELFGESGRSDWNDESVRKEASKYKNKEQFRIGNSGAYDYAKRHKMLNDLFGESFKWDKKSVSEEAKKYKDRTEFKNKKSGAFKYANKLGILDELFPKTKKSEV